MTYRERGLVVSDRLDGRLDWRTTSFSASSTADKACHRGERQRAVAVNLGR